VTNLAGQPIASITTCAHLEPGRCDPELRNGSAYPRCVIGGPAERVAYAAVHLANLSPVPGS
jgi:hypothetical protein